MDKVITRTNTNHNDKENRHFKVFGGLDDFFRFDYIYTKHSSCISKTDKISNSLCFIRDFNYVDTICYFEKNKIKTEVLCILLHLTILSDLNELCESLLSKVRKILLLRGISPNKW